MSLKSLQKRIRVARGEQPADIIISNGKIINVFNGEIEEGNIAISGEYIAGIGDYTESKTTVDIQGKYIAPGFINGHVHIESSMLDIPEYSRAVVPRGTLGIVTDLHEICNVLGIQGLQYVISTCKNLPLDFYFMAPSCVPATELETSGAALDIDALAEAKKMPGVLGLGEVMNYPGVVSGDERVLEKIELFNDLIIDGHAPGLSGKELMAYLSACITSEHECTSFKEAKEKLARGCYIMIREGSSEKNLEELLPLVTDKTYQRCMLVTDDRSAFDIFSEGDMDWAVHRAVSLGLDPVRAIQMATIIPAERFGLKKVGALAPGYYANLVTFSDLKEIKLNDVFFRGYLVGINGETNYTPQVGKVSRPIDTINMAPIELENLKLRSSGGKMPVINIVPDQITTRKTMEEPLVEDGLVIPDTKQDLLKICVVERHKASGNVACGLIKGFGLRKGAVASSVSHDSHNIVAVGTNDEDILAAIKEVEMVQGGIVMALKGKVIGSMALPVAGILSADPAEQAAGQLNDMQTLLQVMGVKLKSPFITLSFMTLPVIPEIRITDKGLIDVEKFEVIN